MARWEGRPVPELPKPSALEWARLVVRLIFLFGATGCLLLIYVLARGVESVIGGRALSIPIIRAWAWVGATVAGLRVRTEGAPMTQGGARVMNHVGWVDVFSILTATQHFFVAKSEVRSWPFMGWLAAFTGTMFVERTRMAAKRQEAELLARVRTGDKLGFFPEGTSTDGQEVIQFKSTLFAAFMAPDVIDEMWIQPVSVHYAPGPGLPDYFYAWWGKTPFLDHFISVISRGRGGVATIHFHDAVRAADFEDRKRLAAYCEDKVREGLEAKLAA